MPDVLLIVIAGTLLFLFLGIFIAFMALAYQRKRLEHGEDVKRLAEAYQREVLKAQVEMQEQTLLAISQEIHDNVGQVLSLVRLHVSTLETSGSPASEQKVRSSKELLDQAIEDLRNLSKQMNSRYTAQQSFESLLEFQLGLLQKTGVYATELEIVGRPAPLEPEKKLLMLRIAQEALSNILKHAEASSVAVRLQYAGNRVTLSIDDNGKGYPVPEGGASSGTGTHNMRYRATLIGAALHTQSTPGKGTSVLLDVPLT